MGYHHIGLNMEARGGGAGGGDILWWDRFMERCIYLP